MAVYLTTPDPLLARPAQNETKEIAVHVVCCGKSLSDFIKTAERKPELEGLEKLWVDISFDAPDSPEFAVMSDIGNGTVNFEGNVIDGYLPEAVINIVSEFIAENKPFFESVSYNLRRRAKPKVMQIDLRGKTEQAPSFVNAIAGYYPLFASHYSKLEEAQFIESNKQGTGLHWKKSKQSLAEYFDAIKPQDRKHEWKPLENIFGVSDLRQAASQNGNPFKGKKSKDFEEIKKIITLT